MLEKLRKMLTDAGIDTAVGSIDYWQNELEGVLLDMYDQGAANEREACAALCDEWFASTAGRAIRERGKPDPAFKNLIDDKWAGIL